MDKTTIIVVEDNIVYCEFVCNMLAREGYHTMKAYHLSTAKKHLQQATDNDIVVADLRLPDGNGIDLLRWMRKEGKMQPFIIMTDYAEVNTAVESMKLGSIDYIPKQLVEDKLVPLIRSILKERQAGQRRMPVFARDGSAFQKIMHRIRLVAATDMSVMIFGENGTGKEHIAHHLHDKSKRAVKPFVAVDCGSLTKELAPSAFFGHVKGAFTGADCAKKGYFHEAEGGTLFLDEVGNLALETQQMLLRAIQERRYRPVGDKADRSFNVRIIAATNEELGGSEFELNSILVEKWKGRAYRLVIQRQKRIDGELDLWEGEYTYRCILTNDYESSEKEIVKFYNLRGGKERIFDEMNNGFGWNRLPKSFMGENTVFLLLTALIRNFYKFIMARLDVKRFGLKATSRIKAFVFRFISVPAKWIRTSRQYVLNIYSCNNAYADVFQNDFG